VRGLIPRVTRGIAPALAAVTTTVNFDFNSAKIRPAAAQTSYSVGIALQSAELAPFRIRIEGHTDSIGSHQYTLKLSTVLDPILLPCDGATDHRRTRSVGAEWRQRDT
jgi:hypothetical protein